MSSLKQTHNRPERYSKSFYDGHTVKAKKYAEVEELIGYIVADIVNGVQRNDIIEKLKKQIYECQTQPYKNSTAVQYYQAAMHRIKTDREEDLEDLKSKLYSQYYQLYAEAMQVGNTLTAKQVLDSIAKIFIGNKPSTAIQVNTGNDKVEINFGFASEKNDE